MTDRPTEEEMAGAAIERFSQNRHSHDYSITAPKQDRIG